MIKLLKKNMSIRVLFFCALFLNSTCSLFASPYFEMSEACLKSQKLIFELNLDDADASLKAEELLHSDNAAINWLKDASLFMRVFTSDDESVFTSKSTEWAKIIAATEKAKYSSAWYQFILSDMYIHRALIKLKFGENLSAGNDVKTAFKLLKDNKVKYPAFLSDNKNLGFLNCLFSSVPKKYQWLVKIAGCKGDMEEGLSEMKVYLNSGLIAHENVYLQLETSFMYAMVQHHLNQNTKEAWKVIEPATRNYKSSIIVNYMRASIAAYIGNNDMVINILNDKPVYSEGSPFYYTDYMLGLAKLRRLDSDAENYFLKFTVRYKGKNYLKSAYRYLSWCHQIKGDNVKAKNYLSLCNSKGALNLEEDKQAHKESQENLIWNASLLKARVLYDGHYLDKALVILQNIDASSLTVLKFKLELNYRMGRVYQAQNNSTQAIVYLKKAIELGSNETFYYAAYSALQLGIIYEEKKDKVNALLYFNKAKDDFKNNQEYVSSIEQKAKAGIKRLK